MAEAAPSETPLVGKRAPTLTVDRGAIRLLPALGGPLKLPALHAFSRSLHLLSHVLQPDEPVGSETL